MSDFSVETLRSIYITNQPYQYPLPWKKRSTVAQQEDHSGDFCSAINTGWHILPNMLWGHVCNPRQWYEMVMKYQSIKVESITCRLFNPIPIQSAVSFQGTSVFPAFNNTVYAMTYTDDEYETPWFDWWAKIYLNTTNYVDMYYEYNPGYKEGLVPKPLTNDGYPPANEAAADENTFIRGSEWFPKDYFSKTFSSDESNLVQYNTYRRQFLPIYWYHFTYKQYQNDYGLQKQWIELSTDFEFAFSDPSGIFWDPLNRPNSVGELRPGKNMVEFSWNVHPTDQGIWFNTDRIGFLTPYGRPKPLQPPSGVWNAVGQPRRTDPRGPGLPMYKFKYLEEMGLVRAGEQITIGGSIMAPETHMGCPDWRRWPIVPSRWFYEELRQSNPWVYENWKTRLYRDQSHTSVVMTDTSTKAGDVELTVPANDIKFAGTEYEQHKYPPTQWFIKGVPLTDSDEKRIPVEMQMWMHIKVNLKGKPRNSALYAPSWGPYIPQELYSINMDTVFGENYMRGRSGGARRTWYNQSDQFPEQQEYPRPRVGNLWQNDSTSCSTLAYPFPIGTMHTLGTTDASGRTATNFEYPNSYVMANKTCQITFSTQTMDRTVVIKNPHGKKSIKKS